MSELNELHGSKDRELQSKQQEFEDDQMKLRAYLERAKIVIRSLDPSKTGVASNAESVLGEIRSWKKIFWFSPSTLSALLATLVLEGSKERITILTLYICMLYVVSDI